MLAGTAAATLIDRAEGLGTVGARVKKLLDTAKSVTLFGLDDAHHRALAREHARHKDGHALVPADALRILTEIVAGHFKDFVSSEHRTSRA